MTAVSALVFVPPVEKDASVDDARLCIGLEIDPSGG